MKTMWDASKILLVDLEDLADTAVLPVRLERSRILAALGRSNEARAEYQRALELAPSEADRNFLARRIAEL
jgi:RNA polymerase sigma-70 factor, ECF subfamily